MVHGVINVYSLWSFKSDLIIVNVKMICIIDFFFCSYKPITDYIDSQFENFLQEELKIKRSLFNYHDTRIHACLYFISPTGHSLRSLDLVTMKMLDSKVRFIQLQRFCWFVNIRAVSYECIHLFICSNLFIVYIYLFDGSLFIRLLMFISRLFIIESYFCLFIISLFF